MHNTQATTPTLATIDITRQAHLALEAICQTEERYGLGYIALLLHGTDRFGLRDESHRQLPIFGSLKAEKPWFIRNLLHGLALKGLIANRLGPYPTLLLTPAGHKAKLEGQEITTTQAALRNAEYDHKLMESLRNLRKQWADEQGTEVYNIFNNKVLEGIISLKPSHFDALRTIEGIKPTVAETYGAALVQCVQENELRRKSRFPALQEVKRRFLAGESADDIAAAMSLTPVTVQNYLETLHSAGELDLVAWAEQHVDPAALLKGSAYFSQVRNPRLKEAYEVLGLDYNTLRMCRLYVHQVVQESQDFKYVA